ncbi:uncharacterized protein LOC118577945 [Onychomys torridus]|uniref:uncharacterized protein LOC118577945 n=1 Tax=Onychomys torridus TaxID=38674 RepID=UPI00167F7679|nr:uncharacterized protein LOC118577945 [Onychomys torridus]
MEHAARTSRINGSWREDALSAPASDSRGPRAGRTKEGGPGTPEGAGGCGARAAAGAASVCALRVLRSRPRADGAPWPACREPRATVRRAHGARTRAAGCPVARRRRRRRRGRRLRPDAQERTAPARVGGGQRGAAARGRAGSCGALAFPHPRPVAGRWRGSLAVRRPLEIEPGCCLHDGSGGRSLRGGGGERKRGVPAAAAAMVAGRGAGEPRAVPEAKTRELTGVCLCVFRCQQVQKRESVRFLGAGLTMAVSCHPII